MNTAEIEHFTLIQGRNPNHKWDYGTVPSPVLFIRAFKIRIMLKTGDVSKRPETAQQAADDDLLFFTL